MVKKNKMGVFTLALLNVAAVLSIVNFPEQAEYGYEIIFYISAGALFFFLPVALISSELAAAFPRDGGVYLWVREAFGHKWGFLTVLMQWLNSLPWFATVLTFIATALGYMFGASLAQNRWFVYIVIVGTMWLCTVLNFRGIKLYERLSSSGVTLGTIIPSAVIIAMAVVYLLEGRAPAIPWSAGAWLPDLGGINQWMLLAGMMVSLAGIDMTAVHVTDVDDPQRNYPKSILLGSLIIVAVSVLGSLAIAVVVPPKALSMASGAPEAFAQMFDAFGLRGLMPVMCILLIVGALTTVFTWTLGPSKGLLEVAREGYLPEFWQYRNKYDIPVRILLIQALVPTLLSLSVFFMDSISNAFWLMMALSSQLYMLMYIVLFAAAVYLRFKRPELKRPYKIPGGKPGIILVSAAGMLTSLAAMIAGLIPPAAVRAEGMWHCVRYSSLLFLSPLAILTLGYFFCRAHRTRNIAQTGAQK